VGDRPQPLAGRVLDPAHGHRVHPRAASQTIDAVIEGGERAGISGAIRVGASTTRDEARDGHLQSPDFFDTERHPEITFASTRFDGDKVVGDLTIRGVTREVELGRPGDRRRHGPVGQRAARVELEGEINRHDFGVSWNTPLPTGASCSVTPSA
jgi:polyisoprenoid-binding protein YceI